LIEVTSLCDVGMVSGPVFWMSKMASEVMCTMPEFIVYALNIAALDIWSVQYLLARKLVLETFHVIFSPVFTLRLMIDM